MPITPEEGLSDIPDLYAFYAKVKDAINALEAKPDKTVGDYMRFAGSVLTDGAPLADKIQAQAKD